MHGSRAIDIFYSDTFRLPLPDGHRFPMDKYRLLREGLLASSFAHRLNLKEATAVTDEDLLRVHSIEYLQKITQGTLDKVEERRIGFPWSLEMVERSRRSTGGTCCAATSALANSVGVHLAGGTHHAFADHGQGFCVFNDVAVAIRLLQNQNKAQRAIVIDLDVHQGNGTAAIFEEDESAFTFSMHCDRNFPFKKQSGDLDIELPEGTGDAVYLDMLNQSLECQLPWDRAEVVFYLAGADPFEKDRLGKLKLTSQGLIERDRLVFNAAIKRQLPLIVVMAGGYTEPPSEIASININTIQTLIEVIDQKSE